MNGSDCLGCGCICQKPCPYIKGLQKELAEASAQSAKPANNGPKRRPDGQSSKTPLLSPP